MILHLSIASRVHRALRSEFHHIFSLLAGGQVTIMSKVPFRLDSHSFDFGQQQHLMFICF